MFFLSKSDKYHETLGVLLDITDNAVNIAIVLSNESNPTPEIVWSYQERVLTAETKDDFEPMLAVSLLRAFGELANNGFVALRKRSINKLPSIIQATIAAPLSYTVSRTVSLTTEKPFKVTFKLFNELEEKAAGEAKKTSESQLLTKNLKLELLSSSTVSFCVNGYPTHFPFKSTASDVRLCQIITLAPNSLVKEINKLKEKFLPKATIDIDSFMSVYFRAVKDVSPSVAEACFINATSNGVELMVLRDSLPLGSTYGKTVLPSTGTKKTVSAKATTALSEDLVALFKNTGDGLSLPKKIYLYSIDGADEMLIPALTQASQKATGVAHQVQSTPNTFFSLPTSVTSTFAVTAYVFHKKIYQDKYLDDSLNMLKY